MKKWKILRSDYLIQHRMVRVRRDTCELPNGSTLDDYYVVVENDVGMVFGLTPAHELLLVEQYKHAIGEICLELPAGIFDKPDGDIIAESRREFVEETGCDAQDYRAIGAFIQNPTRMTSRIHVVLALDVYPQGEQNLDANEDITVRRIPMPQVFEMMRTGQISAVGTVAGIYLAWDYLQQQGIV